MPLSVNENAVVLPNPPTLEALLQTLAPQRPFAVAHNGEFVPKAEYTSHELNDGDRIEIVHPSAGG
jgi:sulfur carrier protein